MATTEERVLAILREHLTINPTLETGSHFVNDLSMNEYDGPGIIFVLEESFNISIGMDVNHPDDLFFFTAPTVGALIQYVDRLVAEQS